MYSAHLLTIAGSDSGGGAGVQADLKTFAAHRTYGLSVITAVTAQNTCAVTHVEHLSQSSIAHQLDAVFSDISITAVKIGMVGIPETAQTIAAALDRYAPQVVVLDPVMVAKSGDRLLDARCENTLRDMLIPRATIVTPNIPEAEVLTGMTITSVEAMQSAARHIQSFGAPWVLVKGGHLDGECTDVLVGPNDTVYFFQSPRIDTPHTHGTGCTLSSSIAANLALSFDVRTSVERAKAYISRAIFHAQPVGAGHGPVHHFHALWKEEVER
ncbi:MAG: bifunctional hydroxymethylpyrimidine kinase/phosphomethylpyrimidine kinase [Bacilli bacterium]